MAGFNVSSSTTYPRCIYAYTTNLLILFDGSLLDPLLSQLSSSIRPQYIIRSITRVLTFNGYEGLIVEGQVPIIHIGSCFLFHPLTRQAQSDIDGALGDQTIFLPRPTDRKSSDKWLETLDSM